MNRIAQVSLFIMLALVSACATPQGTSSTPSESKKTQVAPATDPAKLVEAEKSAMKKCQRLDKVDTSTLMAGIVTESAYEGAIKEARKEAAALGATHIVWLKREKSFMWGQTVVADAYLCR